jgi:hypothetical protein
MVTPRPPPARCRQGREGQPKRPLPNECAAPGRLSRRPLGLAGKDTDEVASAGLQIAVQVRSGVVADPVRNGSSGHGMGVAEVVGPGRIDVQFHGVDGAGPSQQIGERVNVQRWAEHEDDGSVAADADAGAPDQMRGCRWWRPRRWSVG